MKVEPELPDHPKFKRLKKRVGPLAMEYLIRLWGHCQSNRRWEFWPGADPAYVEAVCCWEGADGELFEALAAPFGDKSGWIVEATREVNGQKVRGIVIHDWSKENAGLMASVVNGQRGGRRSHNGQAAGYRQDYQTEEPLNPQVNPMLNPQDNERGERGERGESTRAREASPGDSDKKNAPTVAEVAEWGATAGIPAGYCEHFHRRHEQDGLWFNRQGGLKDWRARLVDWWKKDRAGWRPAEAGPEVSDLEAMLQGERDPARRTELQRRLEEARQ